MISISSELKKCVILPRNTIITIMTKSEEKSELKKATFMIGPKLDSVDAP